MIDNGWYKEEDADEKNLYYYEDGVLFIQHTYIKKTQKYTGWRLIGDTKKTFVDQDVLETIFKIRYHQATDLAFININNNINIRSTYVGCQVGNGNVMVNNWN